MRDISSSSSASVSVIGGSDKFDGMSPSLDRREFGLRGLDGGALEFAVEVEKIESTSFSSWILRLPRTPTSGCALLVMEQLFTEWR